MLHLHRQGCTAIAQEVRCPLSRWRIDVAGMCTRTRSESSIIIECKQSRGDFLRDTVNHGELLARRELLESRRRYFQTNRIEQFEPHLRRSGDSLFPQMEDWDYNGSKLAVYRQVMRELRQIDRKLYGQTKFCLLERYALADQLWILAPRGMIRPRELPVGWGLLEAPWRELRRRDRTAEGLMDIELRVGHPAPTTRDGARHHARLLRNIATAATRMAIRPRIVEPEKLRSQSGIRC